MEGRRGQAVLLQVGKLETKGEQEQVRAGERQHGERKHGGRKDEEMKAAERKHGKMAEEERRSGRLHREDT